MRTIPSIFTLTLNASLDRYLSVETLLPDVKTRCHEERIEAGGGGINVSRIICKLGGLSDAVVSFGGFTGARAEQILRSEGVNIHAHRLTNETRENTIVRDLSKGEEFKLIEEGPLYNQEDVMQVLAIISREMKPSSLLVISGSLPPGVSFDFFRTVTSTLQSLEPLIVVDTSGPALQSALEQGVFLIKPNLSELESLAGRSLKSSAEQVDFARSLIQSGKTQNILLSLGSAGATLISRESVAHHSSPEVAVVSTVGAGDSLLAGTLFKVQSGDSLENAVRFGVCCGAAAVSTPHSSSFTQEHLNELLTRSKVSDSDLGIMPAGG